MGNTVVGTVRSVSDSTFVWEIPNYCQTIKDDFRWRDSPTFECKSTSWCMQFNPYSADTDQTSFCLNFKEKGTDANADVSYQFYIKDVRNNVYWKSETIRYKFNSSSTKGIVMSLRKSDFYDNKSLIAPNDVLSLFLDLKPHYLVSTGMTSKETGAGELHRDRRKKKSSGSVTFQVFPADLHVSHKKTEEASENPICIPADVPQQITEEASGNPICIPADVPQRMTEEASGNPIYIPADVPQRMTEPSGNSISIPADVPQQMTDEASGKPICIPAGADSKLTDDFGDLLSSGEDSDVTLKVGGRTFRAHKLILRARSPVFYNMFKHDMAERGSGIVDIEDCDPVAFEEFLSYVYSGKVKDISSDIAVALFYIAEKYDLQSLATYCIQYIKTNLSVETFSDFVAAALMCDDIEMMESAREFFASNLKGVIATSQWQNFAIENPVAANELLLKAFEKVELRKI